MWHDQELWTDTPDEDARRECVLCCVVRSNRSITASVFVWFQIADHATGRQVEHERPELLVQLGYRIAVAGERYPKGGSGREETPDEQRAADHPLRPVRHALYCIPAHALL